MKTDEKTYFQLTDLWQRLCEEHALLFNLTCDEYLYLLDSDLDSIEKVVEEKNDVIGRIASLENLRKEYLKTLNLKLKDSEKINSHADLIKFIGNSNLEKDQKHFARFNTLLIKIIEKIKKQNKRNQIFLRKAMFSLSEWKKEAFGEKNFQIYTANGNTVEQT
jgi:flagellar biosynthesis/type III secretory pathway chaperone